MNTQVVEYLKTMDMTRLHSPLLRAIQQNLYGDAAEMQDETMFHNEIPFNETMCS